MPTWNTPEARDRVIRTLIGEAAAGDPQSLISVAHVIKNRADSGSYGDKNASGTVLAPLQFSMWNKGMASSGKTISPSDPRYIQAGQIADGVFSGAVPDNTGGADHYYAPSGMPGGQAPSWAVGKTPTATIGGQHFYKLGLGRSDASGPASSAAPAAAASAPVPTVNAQPASAVAPAGTPTTGGFAVPPAAAAPAASPGAYPGSDKYSVVQGMTTGTSHNPQLTTAANWGNLFGGAASTAASPPGGPAAASPVSQPAAAPLPAAPLPAAPPGSPLTPSPGATGPAMPFLANPFDNPAFPSTSGSPPPPKPMALPALSTADFGAPPQTPPPAPPPVTPRVGPTDYPAQHPALANAPNPSTEPGGSGMGFPAQTNPFGSQPPGPLADLPGSMFASAQNLLKLLFPNQTG